MDKRQRGVLDHVVFKTVSGSRSYGLNTPTSDEDTLGVFIPHPKNVLGVQDEVGKHYRGEETDENYKIMPDFVRHARDGSSFWVEPLFVREQDILVLEPVFQPFVDNRKLFLTQALVKKSLGFMQGMINRSKSQQSVPEAKDLSLEEQEAALLKVKRKNMCHSVRVGNMILEMLTELDLRVYRAEEKEHLLGIKTGLVSLEDAWEEAEALIAKIDEKKANVKLAEKADADILNNFLVSGLVEYWYKEKWI